MKIKLKNIKLSYKVYYDDYSNTWCIEIWKDYETKKAIGKKLIHKETIPYIK